MDRNKWLSSKQRWMHWVLYPESQQDAIDYIKDNWPCLCILHDKDLAEDGTLKKPHYHILCHFVNPRYPQACLKRFKGVASGAVQSVDIPFETEKYLTHETDRCKSEGKYIYPGSALESYNDYEYALDTEGITEEVCAVDMMDMLYIAPSWPEFCKMCLQKGYWSTLRRSSYLWHSLYKERFKDV